MKIPLTPVESHQIKAIGHDAATQTLAIQFKSRPPRIGSIYYYANVPATMFERFQAAESKGRFFGSEIKPFENLYPYEKQEAAQ